MDTWYAEAGFSLRFPPQYGDRGRNAWSGKRWTKDRERAVVEKAVRRDAAAFTQLYDNFVDGIFRYVLYKTGHRTEAEDITAQVFLNAWQAIDQYRWTDRPFAAWLYRIAHNLVVDHFRSSRPVVELDQDYALETASALQAAYVLEARGRPLDEIVAEHLTFGTLERMLQRLTPEQQQVIFLRFVEGYDTFETARIMGKTGGAVRTLQHRALKTLSRIMAHAVDG